MGHGRPPADVFVLGRDPRTAVHGHRDQGNVGGGAQESVVRWWGGGPGVDPRELDGASKGTVGAAGRDAAWPSVATDSAGRLWVNYARAGIAECLSAVASVMQPGTTGHAPIRSDR